MRFSMSIGLVATFIRRACLPAQHLEGARRVDISRIRGLRQEHRAFRIIPNDVMTLEMTQATDAAGVRALPGSRTLRAPTCAISWTQPISRRSMRSRHGCRG